MIDFSPKKAKKNPYKILVLNGRGTNVTKIKKILSEFYSVIDPADNSEAVSVLENERIDLVLVSFDAYEQLKDKIVRNKKHLNPNLMKILIADKTQSFEIMGLEEDGSIYHYLESPVSTKELILTLKMAFKNYNMLIDRNRLVSKLNQKALGLLNQRKKLSEALINLKDANLGSIKVLSQAIEAKDPYTRGHCRRVGKLAKAIAEHLNYNEKQMKNLELGAFLHDIGKIGIKGAILNKNGRLTEEEMEHVKTHTVIGENIIKTVKWCQKFIPMIRSHHERYSGDGYPDGLRKDNIPLDARILGIADAFDAMTSQRPYRKALPLKEALRRIKAGVDKQFDPQLVEIFLKNKIYRKDLSSITGISFKTEKSKKLH